MNGWRNEWTGGRNCSGYYSFFRSNPISRTGGKSPDALFSLSSSGSVDRCDGPSATWMPPVLASGSWPKQVSMRQKGKTKKKKQKTKRRGARCRVGRGGRDDALVLVDTCCLYIAKQPLSLLSSFFLSPLLVPHEVTETASKAQLVELQAAGWRAGTCLRPNADFLFTADTASRLRGCSAASGCAGKEAAVSGGKMRGSKSTVDVDDGGGQR